jgi:surfactin synthase thioesterase subunit
VERRRLELLVEQAYVNVVSNFRVADKIYIFGFSRGAIIARLVAYLISKYGVLKPNSIEYFGQPPFLAVWGKNDPFFLPPGAEAFKRDIPGAVVRFFDTGHFALETHAAEIAAAIGDFLAP